jgi:hypothetical protein
VLPVLIAPVAAEDMPPYLRAVTLLDPSGEPVADTLNAVAELAARRRRRRCNRALAGATMALAAIAGLWAYAIEGPALIGTQLRRLLYPPVIEDARVTVDPDSVDAHSLRFDATLYNPSPDALTTVSVVPESDHLHVTFDSSIDTFFAINRGVRRPLTVQAKLRNPQDDTEFRWRLCWNYVRSEDWYAEGMHEESGASLQFAIFLQRHKAQVCNAWRSWQPGN